jgi:prevent-host-death family protein
MIAGFGGIAGLSQPTSNRGALSTHPVVSPGRKFVTWELRPSQSERRHARLFIHPDARANLKDVMDRVVADKTEVIITRQKAEAVVLVSLSEWNSMVETASPVVARKCGASPALD